MSDRFDPHPCVPLSMTEAMKIPSPTGGVKADGEKPRIDLLSTIAMKEIAQVMAFGANKYEAHNWRKGIEFNRLIRAALGHIMDFNNGEDNDLETGLCHLAHAGCCIMFLLELRYTHPELDNRYLVTEAIKVKAQS